MILLRLVSRQTVSLQAVKNESQAKMPKFLHTKCRQASKQAHPPLERIAAAVLQEHRKKKKEKNDRKDKRKKEKLNSRISVSISCL